MGHVIIGMDPHKRSATIEVINDHEKILGQGRFGTDTAGYQAMLTLGREHKDRVWAVEGCNGIGKHIVQRLVADGETVLDVPAKLSARVRVFDTGQGRKTDPVDAHSVAVAALRAHGLRQVAVDDATVALRLLADRRDGLGRARTDTINRLHQQLLELVPGGAKKFLSAPQALRLPKMSSGQVGALEAGTDPGRAAKAEQVEVGHAGSGHYAMMVRCAVAIGLPDRDEHLCGAAPAPDE